MEWPLVKCLLWALLLLAHIHEHRGCIKEERTGLLQLKAFLKSTIKYPDLLLPSWDNTTKSECCGWERVTCNATIGHVIELSLYNINEEPYLDEIFLNLSLLQPFKELRLLDLSNNGLRGWLGNEGT